ncbi:MAG: cadherin-like beta sandwich domain-containing protein [Lachnospiraceae bacterium]|nr:cadherin-like beta sandwich domain-containing protein [Lachnospiraceae bacterium]
MVKLNGTTVENGSDVTWVPDSDENELTVKVTGDDGDTTYTVTLTSTYEPVANTLSALVIGAAPGLTLTPEFDPDVTSYTATTSNQSNKVTATPTSEDALIEIHVGETEIENESSASWAEGENTLTIAVTGDAGEKTYTVVVTRET